jgi:hypothetical protein
MRATGVFRHSPWDGLLVALSLVQGAWLLAAPSTFLVAIGLWWNANTVSHNFIHLPFFRSRRMNAVYAAYLTLLIGVPQGLWRARHLAHHALTGSKRLAGRDVARLRWTGPIIAEAALLLGVWSLVAVKAPRLFFLTYLPGYLAGLGLCALQGHFEHARGTTSHYGRAYNVTFFNDGFHVEHHARPGEHWTMLPLRRQRPIGAPHEITRDAHASAWPPVLRWLESVSSVSVPSMLDVLERVVLRSVTLQRFVLRRHESAFRACVPRLPAGARVTIIGGGLFPRTALIVRRICPGARLTIVDSHPRHLDVARKFLGLDVATIAATFEPAHAIGSDLVVVPLALVGDRRQFYERPLAPAVLVHDWIWRRRGDGARVSWLLLKRMNLVRRPIAEADADRRLSA